jgi:CBS domain containing-hemolysin-like protein
MDGSEAIDASLYGWRLAATLFCVLVIGFFVAAEFSLVKVRLTQIQARMDAGSSRAKTAHHVVTHMDRYLSACQLGITVASLILGWLAEPAIAELLLLGAAALDIGLDPAAPWVHGSALAIALAVVTTLHMTLGEQARPPSNSTTRCWPARPSRTRACRRCSTRSSIICRRRSTCRRSRAST